MTSPLTAGERRRSQVCSTEVIVVLAPAGPVDLRCGDAPMVGPDGPTVQSSGVPGNDTAGTAMGKRYTDAGGTVELLCIKPGAGELSIGGEPLGFKEAKPLPASD